VLRLSSTRGPWVQPPSCCRRRARRSRSSKTESRSCRPTAEGLRPSDQDTAGRRQGIGSASKLCQGLTGCSAAIAGMGVLLLSLSLVCHCRWSVTVVGLSLRCCCPPPIAWCIACVLKGNRRMPIARSSLQDCIDMIPYFLAQSPKTPATSSRPSCVR
jgi:hypothetical protein